jgi:hypothetical protein
LNDTGLSGNNLVTYDTRPGTAFDTYWYDGREKDHRKSGWETKATNNDPDFRDEILSWLRN